MGVVGDVATPLSQHADGRHWLTVRDTWGTPGEGGEGRKPLSPPEGVGARLHPATGDCSRRLRQGRESGPPGISVSYNPKDRAALTGARTSPDVSQPCFGPPSAEELKARSGELRKAESEGSGERAGRTYGGQRLASPSLAPDAFAHRRLPSGSR